MKDKIFTLDEIRDVASKNGVVKNFIPIDIKPMNFKQIKEDVPEPVQHILYPCMTNPSITFIYAASGVGKTMFTLNMAYCIATGGKFLNYRAPAAKKVLYVDGEMQYSQVWSRLMQIEKQQGEINFIDNFLLFTPDKALPYFLPKICDSDGQEFYEKHIFENNINVLILDNISTLSSIDENKSVEWKTIQNWIVKLRSRGVTIIIVHHAGKEKNGYRGTSRMLDVADTAISLQDLNSESLDSDVSNTKRFKIAYQKARSFGGKDSLPFEVTLTPVGWEFQSMEKTNIELVVERIKLKMSHKEIAAELGWSRPYVSKLFAQAKAQGYVLE